MRVALIQAETLETLRVAQHLAPLLGQGGELPCDLSLSGHTDGKYLLSFFPSWHAAQGRQAKCNARRILRLAHAMAFGHPEKGFDGIGAERQADVIQAQCLGGLKLDLKIGSKLQAQSG